MPQTFGLTDLGFKSKDMTTIKNELEAELRKEVDPTLHFGPGSVAGVLTGIVANQSRQVWEALHGLYHSLQPNSATGNALDALCTLTGTFRRKATLSKAIALVTLDAGASLPKGSRIQTIGGHFFKTTADLNNSSNDQAEKEADLVAEKHGPIFAHEQTVAKIMTPVAGWSKAVIKNTCFVGRLDETDDEFRIRRFDELKTAGSATRDAIRLRLQKLDQVEAVHIKESVHSFEVIIKCGHDQEIAKEIWRSKPLGVETAGNVSCEVTDSIGQPRTVRFSRPESIPFSLIAIIKVKKLLEQGEIDAIKNAFLDYGKQHFTLGAEVYPSRFYAIALAYPPILDVISLRLEELSPERYPATIGSHQIASLSFSDINVQQIVEAAE